MSTTTLLNLIFNLLDQHLWLGYFINILLKSSTILLLVFFINFLLKSYSAAARHLIWAVTFIGLFCLPFIIKYVPVMEFSLSEIELTLISEVQLESLNQNAQALSESIGTWSGIIQTSYFFIVFAIFSYTVLGVIRIHLLTRSAQPIESEERRKELQIILDGEGLFSEISILESDSIVSPVSWGFRKPVILLPIQARDWTIEKIRNVFIHEVCHIQRHDWLCHLSGRMVSAMYWCNPLIWIASRKLGEEAERACDDAVVLYGRSQHQYATDLLTIARQVKSNRQRHLLAEAIADSFLGSRVAAILDTEKTRNRTEGVWVIRALLTTMITFVILASLKIVPEVNLVVINRAFDSLLSINFIPSDDVFSEGESEDFPIEQLPKESIVLASRVFSVDRDTIRYKASENPDDRLSSLAQKASPINISLPAIVSNNQRALVNLLQEVSPEYPAQANKRGIEGYSIIEYGVSPQGIVTNPVVIESSPGSIFNRASLNALQDFDYSPPMLNGEPIGINGLRTRFVYQLKPKPG